MPKSDPVARERARVRAERTTSMPIVWYCGRQGEVLGGQLMIIHNMAWWTCDGCNADVDVTDALVSGMRHSRVRQFGTRG